MKTEFSRRIFQKKKKIPISDLIQIRPNVTELSNAERRTNRRYEAITVFARNFAEGRNKNDSKYILFKLMFKFTGKG